MVQACKATRERDAGATAGEYGLLLALVAGVIFGTVLVLGAEVTGLFSKAIGLFDPMGA